MSATQKPTPPSSTSNFISIFDAASKEYKKLTRQDLETHPFSAVLDNCESPDAVLAIFKKQANAFDEFRNGDDRITKWLNPIVHILFTFSATLGEGIGLPFSPGKVIFAGIAVLLAAAKDVVASHGTLATLFEHIQNFLQRLKIYVSIPLTAEFTEVLGKIMAQVLFILALSTKSMTQRRIKKYLKRLVGRTDVEDALQRLDMLTQEETRIAVARNLEVTHEVDGNVKAIKETTREVDGNVKVIREVMQGVSSNTKVMKEVAYEMDGKVKAMNEVTQNVDRKAEVIKEVVQDVCKDTRVIKAVTHIVDDNVKVIKEATEKLNRNQSREKLRGWLSPPNPSINHNIARETHHGGTATWFTEGGTFDEWKTNGSLLWIRGNPGSGKSILCSAIIEDVKRMQQFGVALMAYFYFDFKDLAKRDSRGLLASLLIQLCDYSEDCWDVLSQLYTIHREGADQPSEATLAESLRIMLELPGQLPIYIIIDAIDECPNNTGTPSPREKVLKFTEDLVNWRCSNLCICVTSRPEQDIRTVLDPLTPSSRRVSLHDESGQREDIINYVESFVHSDRAMRRWRVDDKERVINTLSERAGGMFRWVTCQLDTLRRCFPASIKRALNELPTTLDETYERTLEGIPEEKWQHARRLFQCLITSVRPLRVEELAEIFAIQFDSQAAPELEDGWRPDDAEEAVLSACSSLIAVVNAEGSQIVQFSHFSVKEFLTSDRLATRGIGSICRYYIPLEPAHMILAQACLTTLLHFDNDINKNRVKNFPLAFYAAQYWINHAMFKNVSSQLQDRIERLFDPTMSHFRAWIWIYNMDLGKPPSMSFLSEQPPPPSVTPLYYAALCGLRGLTEHLIIKQAQDVNSSGGTHGTPLGAASNGGHVDVARLLLELGANVNARGKSFDGSLWAATRGGHLRVMELLLVNGAEVNAQNNVGWTSLHSASYNGKIEAVRLLLQHNANVNARNNSGWTPLHHASVQGHHWIVQLLLEHGADANAKNKIDSSPLHKAASEGKLEVVRVLLAHGADVHGGRRGEWTPLNAARRHHDVEQLLREYGAERK